MYTAFVSGRSNSNPYASYVYIRSSDSCMVICNEEARGLSLAPHVIMTSTFQSRTANKIFIRRVRYMNQNVAACIASRGVSLFNFRSKPPAHQNIMIGSILKCSKHGLYKLIFRIWNVMGSQCLPCHFLTYDAKRAPNEPEAASHALISGSASR